jgi:hypothetical protein
LPIDDFWSLENPRNKGNRVIDLSWIKHGLTALLVMERAKPAWSMGSRRQTYLLGLRVLATHMRVMVHVNLGVLVLLSWALAPGCSMHPAREKKKNKKRFLHQLTKTNTGSEQWRVIYYADKRESNLVQKHHSHRYTSVFLLLILPHLLSFLNQILLDISSWIA